MLVSVKENKVACVFPHRLQAAKPESRAKCTLVIITYLLYLGLKSPGPPHDWVGGRSKDENFRVGERMAIFIAEFLPTLCTVSAPQSVLNTLKVLESCISYNYVNPIM